MADINKKFYQVKRTIGGVEYTAQFNGLSSALKMVDNSYLPGSSNVGSVALYSEVLENVIVDPPGLDIDSFEDADTLLEVIKFGNEVAQGKFRDKKEKDAKQATGG